MTSYIQALYETLKLQETSAREVYDKFLSKKLKEDEYLKLLKIDPTTQTGDSLESSNKGKYTDWLVTQFLKAPSKERFLNEDSESIKDGLIAFDKLTKNKEGLEKLEMVLDLEEVSKDVIKYSLSQIRSLASLASDQSIGIKDENKINIILDTEKFKVVSPLTHAAARKWGTGTSWCTATSNPQWFNDYTKNGPLFIILDKIANRKWQYHEHSSQFMNIKDNTTSRRAWFYSYIKRGPEWEDAVDEVAEILEKNGCNKWSLSSLEVANNTFSNMSKKTLLYGDQYYSGECRPNLVVAAFTLPMEDFLELMNQIGNPVIHSLLLNILKKGIKVSAPVKEHSLSLLKYVDTMDQDIIPETIDTIDPGLSFSSWEALLFTVNTVKRLPEQDRPLAMYSLLVDKFLLVHQLMKTPSDIILLDIVSTVFISSNRLNEARLRRDLPKIEVGAKKVMSKEEFFNKLKSRLMEFEYSFPHTISYLTSNGTLVPSFEEGKDEKTEDEKTGTNILKEVISTGRELTKEEHSFIKFENKWSWSSIFNSYCALSPSWRPSRSEITVYKSFRTTPEIIEKNLFSNPQFTAIAGYAAITHPETKLGMLVAKSLAWTRVINTLEADCQSILSSKLVDKSIHEIIDNLTKDFKNFKLEDYTYNDQGNIQINNVFRARAEDRTDENLVCEITYSYRLSDSLTTVMTLDKDSGIDWARFLEKVVDPRSCATIGDQLVKMLEDELTKAKIPSELIERNGQSWLIVSPLGTDH